MSHIEVDIHREVRERISHMSYTYGDNMI